jgi:hypothetical protein
MKKYFLIVSCVFLLYIINKKDKIYYIPFDIPGSQLAATIPPFGIFIESKYETNKTILRHEMVHWSQYNRMGFFGFYSTYFSEYKKYGRKNGPMEVEARKLSKLN